LFAGVLLLSHKSVNASPAKLGGAMTLVAFPSSKNIDFPWLSWPVTIRRTGVAMFSPLKTKIQALHFSILLVITDKLICASIKTN
jgi:hypothetical protein